MIKPFFCLFGCSAPIALLVCVSVLFFDAPRGAAQEIVACNPAPCVCLDASAPVLERVRDLVKRMTLDEKVSQLMNRAPAIPRLGVPEYNWWSEALHGVARDGHATNFPQSIGLAATWDTDLMHQVADVISTEARAKSNEALRKGDRRQYTGLTFWSPNVNIFRDPRWGRGMETYGEDPFLSARMGVEFVRGLQGDNASVLKTISTPKHYAVHSGPEPVRHAFNVDVSRHDLEDTYLPAFRATVIEGHAGSVMCAYNAIDGFPACASTMLLKDHLRDAWNFSGYVVSDCDAVGDIARGHHFAADLAHGDADALKAGTDLDCGRAYEALGDAAKQGLVSEEDIDRALTRLFMARFELGMFDGPGKDPYQNIPISENNSPAHRQLALQAARESIVLLKNDGILPLHGQVRKIAVVGPSAEMLEVLEGNYNGTAPDPVLPIDGIRRRFGASAKIEYQQGAIFVEGVGAPVPSSVLRPDPSSAQTGLKAEYFDHPDFSGQLRVTRIDPRINFDWSRVSPADGIPADGFAVRWTGEFVPPAAGDYTLSMRGPKQKIQVYLDGQQILPAPSNPVVHCADTAPRAIRIEYIRNADDRYIDLEWQPPAEVLRNAAVEVARLADVVVAFVGLSPNLEGEEMRVNAAGFNGGDRTRIELPDVQEKLLEALLEIRKPLVIVLTSGSAVALSPAAQHASAILEAWYPGEEGGTAIAGTLAGDNDPAGRLPVTFYRSTSDLPAFTDYSMADRTYRYYKGPVLYPFGYGLSYSTFAYRGLQVSARTLKAGEPLRASVEVTNTSARAGSEVAELYVTPPQDGRSPTALA